MVFRVIRGLLISSKRYSRWREGEAMNSKANAGVMVHRVSVIWFSMSFLLVSLLYVREYMKYEMHDMIISKINIVLS